MLVSMVTETGIDSAIACVANSIYGGAEALGFGLGFTKREYNSLTNKVQPSLAVYRAIRDNLIIIR